MHAAAGKHMRASTIFTVYTKVGCYSHAAPCGIAAVAMENLCKTYTNIHVETVLQLVSVHNAKFISTVQQHLREQLL